MRWRMSSTFPNRILWKIDLLPDERNIAFTTSNDNSDSQGYFDKIQVSVSLEGIKYEYTVREQVKRARERNADKVCVCNYLKLRKDRQEWYWDTDSGLPLLDRVKGEYVNG